MHPASTAFVLLCLILSTVDSLSIKPNKLQFFHFEILTLTCDFDGTIRRNTSSKTCQPCKDGFGDARVPTCTLKDTYQSDSGQYWCESKGGKEHSNILNIVVTAGNVILESPALPVAVGDEVTLRCLYKGRYDAKSTSEFNATFFQDGVFIGHGSKEKLILSVKKSDEGLYMCQHPSGQQSAQSLLAVTDDKSKTTGNPEEHEDKTNNSESPSTGLGPGGTAGVVIALVAVLALIFYVIWKYKHKNPSQDRDGSNRSNRGMEAEQLPLNAD